MARCWLTLFVAIVASTVRADSQSGRFLLVFETSPTLKKNLPTVKQTLDTLFASNLQNEMHESDDLAVWTIDKTLHTGTFRMENWSADGASEYAMRLNDFLAKQNFTRHASLTPVQPLLNRVMKNSERLTVVIFSDSQSRLLGTPYDSGVNEIITNAAARSKNSSEPFVLVLRSYRGEYLGCSVNRSLPLNFPSFPPPPKPETAPQPETTPVVKLVPEVKPPPVVTPVPAMIIVGTNFSTNTALVKPQAPVVSTPQINPPEPVVATPAPAPKIVVTPVVSPPPATNPPVIAKVSTPETTAMATVAFATTNPLTVTYTNHSATAAEDNSSVSNSRWPAIIGGGLLVVAVSVVVWLSVRTRRPRGSLITTSMQDDLRLPPRK